MRISPNTATTTYRKDANLVAKTEHLPKQEQIKRLFFCQMSCD